LPEKDEFLVELYDRLHDSPMQRKFRKIAPIHVGCVFIQWPEMTEADIRAHFRLMKELGFTCLKGFMTCPGTTPEQIMHMALDEGIAPWWYDEGGWEPITDKLLDELGIPRDTPVAEIRSNKVFLDYQTKVFRERIDVLAGAGEGDGEGPDIPYSFDMKLDPKAVPHFVTWLRKSYGSLKALNDAWNMHHAGIAEGKTLWQTWREAEAGILDVNPKEYRHVRDILRFKADVYLATLRRKVDRALQRDPNEPYRAGGEMGLFLPFAARATDMEGIAEEMARGGSFYPSIHLSWHFEEVDFEVVRPVYMQASLAQDWFKGGWAATWESTGGPQQLSGGKAWEPAGAAKTAGFTVDDGVMTQLMLSYLAAGFKGFGHWCWNGRSAGWEAGEYALLGRDGKPTARTIKVGQIGQAARRWRDELWAAHKEPLVGVFVDFDNEAMWAAISVCGRDKFRHVPIHARVGVSRALINHNVPWEHVTATDLRKGLARRYRVIYLPAAIALSGDLLDILSNYVCDGGRLVLDMPGAYYDEFGRLLPTGEGTPFEGIFGCVIRDYQYSSNVPRSIEGVALDGFVLDLGLTSAQALAHYDSGAPAIAENRLGKGAGVVLGYEASLTCCRPGDIVAEEMLVRHALGEHCAPYGCDGAIAYRLAAPAADHYFLINDGPATSVTLDTRDQSYHAATDAVTQEALEIGAPIELPAHSGRWLRYARA